MLELSAMETMRVTAEAWLGGSVSCGFQRVTRLSWMTTQLWKERAGTSRTGLEGLASTTSDPCGTFECSISRQGEKAQFLATIRSVAEPSLRHSALGFPRTTSFTCWRSRESARRTWTA